MTYSGSVAGCRQRRAERRCGRNRAVAHLAALAILVSVVSAGRADSGLPAATLKAVKNATVYLRVTLPDSQVVQGSGFFGVEPNVVLTNAHVLGMLRPESRRPAKIAVVLHSGQADEKSVEGEVLGVDRSSDLAVVRVTGKGLPEPLPVVAAKDLAETQEVYVFGFPFGDQLGKDITINKTSVSSLRKNAFGIVSRIQVNGGMHPGNSGGPVVDDRGRVVGVAVSGLRNTQIHFAVPGDYVHVILNGRVTALTLGQPYREGDRVTASVTMHFLDPLGRVRKAALGYWEGAAGGPRPATPTEPQPRPGDTTRQTLALDYRQSVAHGEWTLPALESGKVYWYQPVYVNGAGETRWVAATMYRPEPPVERKPVVLKSKQPLGRRAQVELTSDASLKVRDLDDEDHNVVLKLNAGLIEETEAEVDTEDMATTKVSYRRLDLGITLDNKPLPLNEHLQRVAAATSRMTGEMQVDPKGNVVLANRPGPRRFRDERTEIHEQVLLSLQAIAVPLPGTEVSPGKPWKAQRQLLIGTLGEPEAGVADLTYTYLGTRSTAGRPEAVLQLAGTLRGVKGKEVGMAGRITGAANVDIATGQVTSARTTIDVDMDTTSGRHAAKASGTLEVHLRRSLAVGTKED